MRVTQENEQRVSARREGGTVGPCGVKPFGLPPAFSRRSSRKRRAKARRQAKRLDPTQAACVGMVNFRRGMMRQVKIIVEKHADGYVAYPLGLKGTVVGEGGSYEEALADVKSAIWFHLETFGAEVLPDDSPLLEAFVAEATFPA